jgi:hypothetical protein
VDPSQQYEVRLKTGRFSLGYVSLSVQIPLIFSEEEQERLWNSIILAKVEGFEEFCGLVIQSVTSPDNYHLVFNLHSFVGTIHLTYLSDFEDGDNPGFPLPGFPSSNKVLAEFWAYSSEDPKRKKAKIASADALQVELKYSVLATDKHGQATRVCLFVYFAYFKDFVQLCVERIGAEDVKYISAQRDVVVLFDKPFHHVLPAPITPTIMATQRVHLMGYATWDGLRSFVVPGEVTSVSVDNFTTSCPSIEGLSGSGVVCDRSKGVLGYSGGAAAGTDKSPFGSYAYPLSYVVARLKERVEAGSEDEK